MTNREHEAQREMVSLSLLLSPVRSERHGVYRLRVKPRPKRASWAMPVVNEKKL